MVNLVEGMGLILATWCVIGASFVGIGLLARHAVRNRAQHATAVFTSFWVGWALVLMYLQLWNFVFPITLWTLIVPILVGAYGWCVSAGACAAAIVRSIVRHPRTALVAGLAILWTANQAMAPLTEYDAGLYHLSAIHWANAYPVVPGLGNLSWPLSFNNSAFLYMAMLNVGPWAGRAYCFADSLLLVVFLVQLLVSLARVCRTRVFCSSLYDMILALLFVPTLVFVFAQCSGVATVSTDLPVFILQVLVSAQLLQVLAHRRQADVRATRHRLLVIALLVGAGLSIKLTFAVLGAAALAIALVVFWLTQRRTDGRYRPTLMLLLAIGVLFVLPWMARDIILNGYPAFPETLLAPRVDWKIPVAQIHELDGIMRSWARWPHALPQQVLGSWHWLQPWYAANAAYLMPPIVIAIVAFVSACVFSRRGQSWRIDATWLFLAPALIGALVWFAVAPDPRYAGALPWILASGAVAVALGNAARPLWPFVVGLVGAIILFQNPHAALSPLVLASPGPVSGLHAVPHVPLRRVTVSSGLRLYVPVYGDQVWDAPLPATPYPNTHLRLRCAHTLRCGFVLAQQ